MNSGSFNAARLKDFVDGMTFGVTLRNATEDNLAWIRANALQGARILDIGAGTGRLAIPLAREGYLVTALEPRKEALEVLMEKAERDGLKIETVHKKIAEYSCPASFDLAICVFSVMNYITSVEEMEMSVKRMADSLKPGGKLLFDLAVIESLDANFTKRFTGGERTYKISRLSGNIYRQEESARGVMNGEQFDYREFFDLMFWEASEIHEMFRKHSIKIERIEDQMPAHTTCEGRR